MARIHVLHENAAWVEPLRDAFDHIFVLLKDCEEPRVVFGLRLEVLGGRRPYAAETSTEAATVAMVDLA